jgi:DNA-binding CsgD family transcriptional regulator
VFSLLGAGLNTKQIAARLFISTITVRTHLARLQEKLGCASRAELVVLAARRVPEA